MNAIDLTVLNLQETRRRSIQLWRSLPDSWITWRPDQAAMSFGEMIRHVWGGSYNYHRILMNNGSMKTNDPVPFDQEPIVSVEKEIELSEPYFNDFIEYVRSLSTQELQVRLIDRSDVGYQRYLGDMLLRMAGLERPRIWD